MPSFQVGLHQLRITSVMKKQRTKRRLNSFSEGMSIYIVLRPFFFFFFEYLSWLLWASEFWILYSLCSNLAIFLWFLGGTVLEFLKKSPQISWFELFFLDCKTWQITKRKSLCKTWRWRAVWRSPPLGLAWNIHSSRKAKPSTYTTSEFGFIMRRKCISSACSSFTVTKTHWEGASTYCHSTPTKTDREGSSTCCNSSSTCKTHREGEILSGKQDGWFWFGWPCERSLVTQSQHQ